GKVIIERPDALALPQNVFSHSGGKSYIWRVENGRALRTEVQVGIRGSGWIEVTNRHAEGQSEDEAQWIPFDGSENVLEGEKISTLTEGARVRLANAPAPPEGESGNENSDGSTAE